MSVQCTLTPPGKYGWTIVRGGYKFPQPTTKILCRSMMGTQAYKTDVYEM